MLIFLPLSFWEALLMKYSSTALANNFLIFKLQYVHIKYDKTEPHDMTDSNTQKMMASWQVKRRENMRLKVRMEMRVRIQADDEYVK